MCKKGEQLVKIFVYGIVWDTSSDEKTEDEHIDYSFLPDHVEIDTDYDIPEDKIADCLSDEYGYCIESIESIEYEDETIKDLDGMAFF